MLAACPALLTQVHWKVYAAADGVVSAAAYTASAVPTSPAVRTNLRC